MIEQLFQSQLHALVGEVMQGEIEGEGVDAIRAGQSGRVEPQLEGNGLLRQRKGVRFCGSRK